MFRCNTPTSISVAAEAAALMGMIVPQGAMYVGFSLRSKLLHIALILFGANDSGVWKIVRDIT